MLQVDMKMPSCCNECNLCSCQRIGIFYCDITASYIDIDSDERDADCPLKEVNESEIKDCIDREATKQAIRDFFPNLGDRCEINSVINMMPSAYPKNECKTLGRYVSIDTLKKALCCRDEDYDKPCISPHYLEEELDSLALDDSPSEQSDKRISECHRKNIETYAHDFGVLLEQAEKKLRVDIPDTNNTNTERLVPVEAVEWYNRVMFNFKREYDWDKVVRMWNKVQKQRG